MTINLTSSNFNYMIANYNDPSSPKTVSKWAMQDFGGFTNSTYPTTYGVFNSTGSSNLGGFSDSKADTLITNSISSPNASAVTAEASYLTTQQPGLFQPLPDNAFGTSAIVVWQKDISGEPNSFATLTQPQWNPEYWFLTT
jgi:peptide/nickel transport system substrate-binding protein